MGSNTLHYQNNMNTNLPSYINNPFNHSIAPPPMPANISHTVSQQPSSYIENNNYNYQNSAPSSLQQLNMVPPPTNQLNNQLGNLNQGFENKYSLDNLIQNPLSQATSQIITTQYAPPPQTLHQPLGNITNMNYPGSMDYNNQNQSVGYLAPNNNKTNNLFNPNIPTQTQYQENQNPGRFNGIS